MSNDNIATIWVIMLDGDPNKKETRMLRACMLMTQDHDQQELADKVMAMINENCVVMTQQ